MAQFKIKNIKVFSVVLSTMILLLFNNCDPVSKPFEIGEGINSLQVNNEKPAYLVNAITPANYDIIMYTHREFFLRAESINWEIDFSSQNQAAGCTVLEVPSGQYRDWIRFECNDVGEATLNISAYFDHDQDPNTPSVLSSHETKIYITNNILVAVNDGTVFPQGRGIPATNRDGGGGQSPPLVNQADIIAHGQNLFDTTCFGCHTAFSRKELIEQAVAGGSTAFAFFDDALTNTAPMSGNATIQDYNIQQREAILEYILSTSAPDPQPDTAAIQRGNDIFNTMQFDGGATCVGCHTSASRASRVVNGGATEEERFQFLDNALDTVPAMANNNGIQNLNEASRRDLLAYLLSL